MDQSIKDKLYASAGPELEMGVHVFVQNGAKVKGMKSKEALAHVLCQIVELAYKSGLERGYNVARHELQDG